MKFEPPSHSLLVVCMYYCCNLQVSNNERNKTFEVADDSPNLIFSLMSKTLLSRIKPHHNPKPSSSPSFSFKPLIKRLVNELCDILKTHHHNQWQDTLETRLSKEEIVPSDIAHLVLDRIRDPELGLKFFDWVTQRPYGCSLDGFAYSFLLKLLASSRVFSEIETVLESMKVEDKLPTREALDAVIRAYSDSGSLEANQFSGSVPPELGKLSNLTTFVVISLVYA
ncbi:pentatricopeptide repeat-containing protein At1g52620-like isoform X1 [Camellia sinensis]|uniref:pentatricopeptide repeat-containing protein At1g52620-like isoform X1 n=1 Tax=Camellia sinensis TaxID=4442 RepID=UPI0010357A6A|nr:pentatricopeptide repeat-containing protein At1g52620-like isoform X1 [Camellia sinensis]